MNECEEGEEGGEVKGGWITDVCRNMKIHLVK